MKAFIALLLAAAATAAAQRPDAPNVPNVPLQRTITLDLHSVSRDAALVEIGRAAGLNVVYAADLVPTTGVVTFAHETITVSSAIDRALAGVAVDVVAEGNGTITLQAHHHTAFVSIDGVVIDSVRHTPVRLAAVRLGHRGETVLTDDAGRFHFAATAGAVALDVRRIGFRPASLRVDALHATQTVNVALTPGAIGLDAIVVNASELNLADDAGRRVMTAALARRSTTRASMRNYAYDAHLRLVEGEAATSLDSASVVVARETVIHGYWESSGRAQQTIAAQRRAERVAYNQFNVTVNSFRVMSLVAFDADVWRVVGEPDIPMPSPIAPAALDHYRFSVLDTTTIGNRRAIRLAIRPRSSAATAFDGIIDVADSTFDILNVRVGLSASAESNRALDDLRLDLRFADAGGNRWMPVALTTTLHSRANAFFSVASDYVASIGGYRFDVARPGGLGVFKVVVAANAERASDDVYASAPALPPLPVPMAMTADGPAVSDSTPSKIEWNKADHFRVDLGDFSDVRFNRVDGWSYSVGGTWEPLRFSPALTPTLRLGRTFGSERTTYRAVDSAVVSSAHRALLVAGVHDETLTPASFAAPDYNPTLGAILGGPGADAQQYFREHGFDASAGIGFIGLTQLSIGYHDVRRSSLPILARYARTDGGRLGLVPIPNRLIDDGHLKSISASIVYDSRPLLLEPHRYERLDAATFTDFAASGTFTRISLDAEGSDPGSIGGDFAFRRYQLRVDHHVETWLFGTSDIAAIGGWSSGRLPLQRLFLANGGSPLPSVDAPFATIGDSLFGGAHAAAIVASHDFDQATIHNRHLPLVSSLPVSLTLSAAALWASSANETAVHAAPSAYTEVGATVAYALSIAPHAPRFAQWFAPSMIAVRFSSQLSGYDTQRSRITLGIRRN